MAIQMGFLNFFAGKSIQDYEQKGDTLAASNGWGQAKLEYEAALDKLEAGANGPSEDIRRIETKIRQCKEKLAAEHLETGRNLLDSGSMDEAREYFTLAYELTADPGLKSELEKCLEEADQRFTARLDDPFPQTIRSSAAHAEENLAQEGENYFTALISPLPEDVQQTYSAYGQVFREGYMALNRGDFEQAANQLDIALAETTQDAEYIRLELATAYMNLNRLEEARQQLEILVTAQPHALPAYQMLCEIFWEQEKFEQAESILNDLPEELKASTAAHLLRGETYYQSGRFRQASELYQNYLEKFGWNEAVARALAIACETDGQLDKARDLYGKIMNLCRSCHARIDPFIKQRFADLSLEAGHTDGRVLELYLSLTQENPENAAVYYAKISAIYQSKGNLEEAQRFRFFAEQLKNKSARKTPE